MFEKLGKTVILSELKKDREVHSIIIHCSASKVDLKTNAKTIHKWHLDRGFSGCGYHFVITGDGTIQYGRDTKNIGSHAKGHNTGTIGVCYIGGVDSKGKVIVDSMNEAQSHSMKTIIRTLKKIYGSKTVIGHNELPYVNKACPCLSMDLLREEL